MRGIPRKHGLGPRNHSSFFWAGQLTLTWKTAKLGQGNLSDEVKPNSLVESHSSERKAMRWRPLKKGVQMMQALWVGREGNQPELKSHMDGL